MKNKKQLHLPSLSIKNHIETIDPELNSVIKRRDKRKYLLAKDLKNELFDNLESSQNINQTQLNGSRSEIQNIALTGKSEINCDVSVDTVGIQQLDYNQSIHLPSILPQNIFNQPFSIFVQENDPNIGPRYKDGQLLPYTFVGKKEWFLKQSLKIILDKSKFAEALKMSNVRIRKTNGSSSQIGDDSSPSFKKFSHSRLSLKNIRTKKFTYNNNDKIITKKEVEDIISVIRQRIRNNQEKELKSQNKLDFQQLRSNRSNQKVLQKFEEQEKDWNQLILNQSKRLKRDPQQSQLLDLYEFRKKREYALSNHQLSYQFDNKTAKIWEMKINDEIPSPQVTTRQLHSNLKEKKKNDSVPIFLCEIQNQEKQESISIDPKPSGFEVIRKTSIVPSLDDSKIQSSVLKSFISDKDNKGYETFKSFTTQEYLRNRYDYYLKEVRKINGLKGSIEVSPQNLYVSGINQFKFEFENILREPIGFYAIQELKPETNLDETFAENYDYKHFHSKLEL